MKRNQILTTPVFQELLRPGNVMVSGLAIGKQFRSNAPSEGNALCFAFVVLGIQQCCHELRFLDAAISVEVHAKDVDPTLPGGLDDVKRKPAMEKTKQEA